jgi:hypothetical protein
MLTRLPLSKELTCAFRASATPRVGHSWGTDGDFLIVSGMRYDMKKHKELMAFTPRGEAVQSGRNEIPGVALKKAGAFLAQHICEDCEIHGPEDKPKSHLAEIEF